MGGSSSSQWEGYAAKLQQDTIKQTIEMEGTEKKGATAVYRSPQCQNGFQMYMKSADQKTDLETGWLLCKQSFTAHANNPCFGFRPFVDPTNNPLKRGAYKFDTYADIAKQVYSTGNGLASLDLAAHSNIGIFSSNRSEWMVVHLGNWSQSYRTVALYDTLGADAVQYIVWHAELSVIFVEKDKLPQLWKAVESCPKDKEMQLKYVVQFDVQNKYNNQHENVDENDVQKAKELGLELIGFTQLMQKGGDSQNEQAPKPSDLAYLMYTSGTTGVPKGVMLTQQCFACSVSSAFRALINGGLDINSEDRHVSYLPLAHIFEANIITFALYAGASVAFFGGNIKTISEDWKEIRPTLVFGVPRIYNKTYDKVKLKVKAGSGLKQWLFAKAEASSSAAIRNGDRVSWWDTIIWSKVAAEIGFDQAKVIVSGAAPLPPYVAEFLRIVFPRASIMQGYGLTETCAVSFLTTLNDLNLGHVGCPADNVEYRLVDAPECEYFTTDQPQPRGEVQIRGPTLMSGYFKNEEATKKAIDENGWLSTGDIGRINPNGTLSIIDRRKNMFKTAMGEYIAAEKIETVYVKAASVNQLWIYGNSFKSFVVAVVVPDALWLVPKLQEKGLWTDEQLTPATQPYCDKFNKICQDNAKVVKDLVVSCIKEVEKKSDLKSFERVKDYYIESQVDCLLQGFNVENGTLTPTFKLKRPQLLGRYKNAVKQMYADNGEAPKEEENW